MRRSSGPTSSTCPAIKSDRDKSDFAAKEFARARRKHQREGVRALVEAVGKDLRELASACSQLVADTEGVIDGRSDTYHGGKVEATGFRVADAAVAGQAGEALRLLRHAIAAGLDPVPIVAVLASQVRQLVKVGPPGGAARVSSPGPRDGAVADRQGPPALSGTGAPTGSPSRSRRWRRPTSRSRAAAATRCMRSSVRSSPSPARRGSDETGRGPVTAGARFGRAPTSLVTLSTACALRSCAHAGSIRSSSRRVSPRPVPSSRLPPSQRQPSPTKKETSTWQTSSRSSSASRRTRSGLTATGPSRASSARGSASSATPRPPVTRTQAADALKTASKKLDKAVSKGVIHKNQAANKKSAMAKKAAAL